MSKLARITIALQVVLIIGATLVIAQTPLTNALNLRVRTDAAGSLITSYAAMSGSAGPLTAFGNIRLRTDSNGYLLTTAGTGTFTPDSICMNAANQDVCLGRLGSGLFYITDNDLTPLIKTNVSGIPVASSCGDGAVATGSSNSVGRVDSAATMTGCTLTFSVTFAGNNVACIIENLVANRGNVTAVSSTAFTVSNLTAGDDFMYHCYGY